MESKRVYDSELESFEATELSLAPPGSNSRQPNKRPLAEDLTVATAGTENKDNQDAPHAAKAQVVGWPPVRSFRRNNFQQPRKEDSASGDGQARFVKVSMDGAPYQRKIDLNMYKGYKELRHALDDMFKCFAIRSDCAIAYEDKDADWMLAGDVPWQMFISSCNRLRIMKGSDARGLGSNP